MFFQFEVICSGWLDAMWVISVSRYITLIGSYSCHSTRVMYRMSHHSFIRLHRDSVKYERQEISLQSNLKIVRRTL